MLKNTYAHFLLKLLGRIVTNCVRRLFCRGGSNFIKRAKANWVWQNRNVFETEERLQFPNCIFGTACIIMAFAFAAMGMSHDVKLCFIWWSQCIIFIENNGSEAYALSFDEITNVNALLSKLNESQMCHLFLYKSKMVMDRPALWTILKSISPTHLARKCGIASRRSSPP